MLKPEGDLDALVRMLQASGDLRSLMVRIGGPFSPP